MTVRRVARRRGGNEIDFKMAKARLDLGTAMANAIEAQDALVAAATAAQEAQAKLFAAMKASKLIEFKEGLYIATIERASGRSSNTVDPVKFRKAVKDDAEFFGAITVSMTEAKKVLPEKTLKTMTTTIPGKAGEESVKLTRVKAEAKVRK